MISNKKKYTIILPLLDEITYEGPCVHNVQGPFFDNNHNVICKLKFVLLKVKLWGHTIQHCIAAKGYRFEIDKNKILCNMGYVITNH